MSDNLSKGPVQVISNDVLELNSALQRIQDRLDELQGLRGRAMIFDRVRVGNPEEAQDALTLGTGNENYLGVKSNQTVTGNIVFTGTVELDNVTQIDGVTTFNADVTFSGSTITISNGTSTITITNELIKYVDANGSLIHAWGTITP